MKGYKTWLLNVDSMTKLKELRSLRHSICISPVNIRIVEDATIDLDNCRYFILQCPDDRKTVCLFL